MAQKTTQVFTSTPLIEKLGVVEDMKIYTINPPENYFDILGALPKGVEVLKKTERKVECVHVFVTSHNQIAEYLEDAYNHIFSLGMIWVSWPRKDEDNVLSEKDIKLAAYNLGLRDEKLTIVDDFWGGLLLKPSRNTKMIEY